MPSSLNFKDSCLTTQLETVSIDNIDSIIYLVDECNSKKLAILAAKYNYPDGNRTIESSINDSIIESTETFEYFGDYAEDYHELVRELIKYSWKIKEKQMVIIERDTTREIIKRKN